MREELDRIEYEVTEAYVLRQILVDKGLVIMPGIREIPHSLTLQCYVNEDAPDQIDEMVLLKDVQGAQFGYNQRTGQPWEHVGVLVNLRHTDPVLGSRFAKKIGKEVASANITATVGRMRYYVQTVYRASRVLSLGEEVGKRRFRWSFDVRIAMSDTAPTLE